MRIQGSTLVIAVAVIVVILIATGAFNLQGSVGAGAIPHASGASCQPTYAYSVSDLTDGIVHNQLSGNNHELIVTANQLSSDSHTPISFKLIATRTDACQNAVGGELADKIDYEVSAHSFRNVVDSSDSTLYYTVQWVNNRQKYNITADGVEFATVNKAQDTTTWSTPGEAVIVANVGTSTDLNKAIDNLYDSTEVMRLRVPNGHVTVRFMKTE